ncbi:hypothetical protein [Nocardia sp. NPDC048505]|uniref:hypothetical protein n=1 Tax=unclassified Nocardia TaxID=2637762 RepID=UPI00340FC89F
MKLFWPLIPLLLYLALRPFAAALSDTHGFGSPDGVNPVYLAVTGLMVALRLLLLVVVPGVLAYRAVGYLVNRVRS